MDYSFDNLLYKYGSVSFYRDGEHVIEQFYGAPLSEPLFEAYLHTFAYESGLAVPRIEEVFSHGENCYIVYECPTVIKLSELLTDGFTDELLSRFVELQVKVHGKKAPKMHKLREKMHEKLGASPVHPTRRYELHNELDMLPKHNKLCHGSFLPENILVSEDGEMLITGWSGATQGNASADASYTYLNLCLKYGIETAERYLSMFCELSDIAREYVERWMPIVAATMLKDKDTEEAKLLNQFIIKPKRRAKNV